MLFQVSYTSENVVEGKKAAKEALQQRLGLKKANLPLVGIITRLTHQKGIHLIKHAIWRTLDRNGQVIFLSYFHVSSCCRQLINTYYTIFNECPISVSYFQISQVQS